MAKRYQPQALTGEQGGVQTFAGRDAVNGLPVRMYTFMGEPTAKVGELGSPHIPPVLSSSFVGGAGEVIVAFSPEFRTVKGAVAPGQVEALLRGTAAALDDAARAGIVHGDLSPERVLFDREAGAGGRFLLEGYGVPWRVKPSEFTPPERIGGPSFAADLFSWAMTVRHLSGPLPGDLRDLLSRCLNADPKARPQAREVRAALESYPFGTRSPQPSLVQSARDVSAFEDFGAKAQGDDADDFSVTLMPEPEAPLDVQFETDQPETIPAPGPHTPPISVPIPPRPGPGVVRLAAREPVAKEPALPADAVRRIDQTTAYEARRARYNAERVSSDPAAPTQTTSNTGRAVSPVRPVRAAPVTAPVEPEFDVVDDIDDRAPDPTLNRGGRRVLLLTLLGIALLVLVALQLINT
ncbi:MAG: hypothetical protein AVDCRST_MAG86-944 [uncultured Truepera sp.]|uniref:Protein kinase domain-containing protein n=1 Tax=uncultured Truepera sp. TaxID=543023 RepID=A0A6J4UY90_9DEIN|nr:MAG: hypothetical protein AVDCRST_MAG86-944 [uncultured Truepera sp.]